MVKVKVTPYNALDLRQIEAALHEHIGDVLLRLYIPVEILELLHYARCKGVVRVAGPRQVEQDFSACGALHEE